jgi:uncharacterized protein with HEPN domain
MRDFKLYLMDILQAMEAIEQFVHGLEFDQFKQDDKTSSAVIRKFEIIGEAVKNVPDDIRLKYGQIPRRKTERWRTEKCLTRFAGLDHVPVNFSGVMSNAIFLSWLLFRSTQYCQDNYKNFFILVIPQLPVDYHSCHAGSILFVF